MLWGVIYYMCHIYPSWHRIRNVCMRACVCVHTCIYDHIRAYPYDPTSRDYTLVPLLLLLLLPLLLLLLLLPPLLLLLLPPAAVASSCCCCFLLLLLLLPPAAAAARANILPKQKITVSVALFGADGRYGRETPAERGNVSGWLE